MSKCIHYGVEIIITQSTRHIVVLIVLHIHFMNEFMCFLVEFKLLEQQKASLPDSAQVSLDKGGN